MQRVKLPRMQRVELPRMQVAKWSIITRKLVFKDCEQVMRKPSCSAAETRKTCEI